MLSPAELEELKALRLREARLAELQRQLLAGPGRYALTQADLATLHNLSRHQIRQLEARALLKARRALLSLQQSSIDNSQS